MKFSVLLCTYNADEESVIYTLDSLVSQTLTEKEIIVCDDGSKDPMGDLYRRYFDAHRFSDYKLSFCPVNGGTVKNILAGLDLAEGEYIKPIGAGDALADPDVLRDMYDLMDQEKSSLGYGPMRLFTVKDGDCVFRENVQVPVSGDLYAKGSSSLARRRMIGYGDNISGSQLFYEAAYFRKLMKKLSECVVYTEDLSQYLALLEGRRFSYLDRAVILYEGASGISTAAKSSFDKLLKKDRDSFLSMLEKDFPGEKSVKIRKKMEDADSSASGRAGKAVRKILADPGWAAFRFAASRHGYIR